MQFQNAVITPSGIAIFSAANANKPIKFTRFLFTDSTTRLTGQETELPANTWGNGSVDAVVGQDELQQFVIYASASNEQDYGYARGYGIYAVQDDVEYLVAVANCLGDPTYVSPMSGGYTRFHLALTIKYNVNSSVITVEPNMAGLISRAEFESWTERVVTTHSPSGAPFGEEQWIYGRKWFRDDIEFGSQNNRLQIHAYADMSVNGAILPLDRGNAQRQIGSELSRWPDIYCNSLHADYISGKGVMVIDGSTFPRITENYVLDITNTVVRHADFEQYPNRGYAKFDFYIRQDWGEGVRKYRIQKLNSMGIYLNADSRFLSPYAKIKISFVGNDLSGNVQTEEFAASIASASIVDPAIPGQTFKMVTFENWAPQNSVDTIVSVNDLKYVYIELELME